MAIAIHPFASGVPRWICAIDLRHHDVIAVCKQGKRKARVPVDSVKFPQLTTVEPRAAGVEGIPCGERPTGIGTVPQYTVAGRSLSTVPAGAIVELRLQRCSVRTRSA